jgi:hypothetical protein
MKTAGLNPGGLRAVGGAFPIDYTVSLPEKPLQNQQITSMVSE